MSYKKNNTFEWAREVLSRITEKIETHMADHERLLHDYAYHKISANEIEKCTRESYQTCYESIWLFRYGLGDDPDLESYIFDEQTNEILKLLELGTLGGEYHVLPYFKRQVEYYLSKLNEYDKTKEIEVERCKM